MTSTIKFILGMTVIIGTMSIVSCGMSNIVMDEELFTQGNWNEVEKYIESGGDVNWRSKDHGLASYYNNMSLLNFLIAYKQSGLALKAIERGANLKPDANFGSVFNYAARMGLPKVVDEIYKRTIENPKEYGVNLIEAYVSAAEEGHLQVIKLILSYGVDVNSTSGRFSALYLALYQGHEDIAQYLLSKGADYHFKTDDNTSLLVPAAIGGNLKLMKLLVEKGLSVNQANDTGDTPLLAAMIGKNKIKIAEYLLSQGANPCVKNNEGYSAYSLAMNSETALELKKLFSDHECE